jgi:hypothetical protein
MNFLNIKMLLNSLKLDFTQRINQIIYIVLKLDDWFDYSMIFSYISCTVE